MCCHRVAVGLSRDQLAQATTWSDTPISYRYGTQLTEPYNPDKVEKHILPFSHASVFSLGQNIFNLDLLQSDSADTTRGSASVATEAYLVYRHQLHAGKIFDKPVAFGPVKDMTLTARFDLKTKDTGFAPRKSQLLVRANLQVRCAAWFPGSQPAGSILAACRVTATAFPSIYC